MFTDLNVADHPTDNPGDWVDPEDAEAREMFMGLLRGPMGYQLVRTLNLTKYTMRRPDGTRYSVPTQGFLGEVYEYRNVLRMDKVCTTIREVAGGLDGDLERCQNTAEYRTIAYQGYPIEGDWLVCRHCAREETDTDYVSLVDGRPFVR